MKNGNTKLVCNLIFVVFLAGTIGCGGKGLLGNISERISGPDFELTVWDETFAHGGLANKVVMVREDLPTTTIVRIEVDGASDLKAIYCTLNYNAGRYTPKSVTIEPLLADGSGLLELANYSLDGKVDIGQAIAGLPGFPGFEGSGLFAEIEFSNGSRPRVRRTSSAPTDDYSRTTLYKNGNQLSWRNYCTGDYDQNGEVNVADITPLAINYGATGPFDVGQAVSCVDGDWNGEINLADITPIATAYGNTVEGYNIYASPGGAGFPIGSTDANGPGVTFLDSVAFDQAAALDGERKLFSYPLASEVPGDDYWVRPFVGKADGIASTLAQTGGSGSGLELVLSNTPAEGDGATPGTAYIVDDQTNYSFEVVRSLGGTNTTVTLDAETRFIVSNASAGTVDPATAILNITVGHEGLVAVQAAYEASGTLYSNYVWLQIGTAGTYLALTIGNPPTDGSGLSTNDPFMGNDTTDYQFTASLINGGSSTDVTTDALTTFTVSNSGAGEVNPATGVLNVTDGFEGIFNVQAVYEFEGFLFSNLMWVQVGGGGPTTEILC